MKKIMRGFTMIELLIVIAILGILAVAVLSAINPLEQIRRGRDTGSRSDAEQLLNAVERYYAMKGYMPWQTSEGDTTGIAWEASTDAGGLFETSLSELVSADEIKQGFTSRITQSTANPIMIFYDGTSTSNSAYACFLPQSKAMKKDGAAECAQRTAQLDFTGILDSACVGGCQTGTWTEGLDCYLCLP